MRQFKEAILEIGHIYLARLHEAYAQANQEGWRTFYSRILQDLMIENEPLNDLLKRLGENGKIFPPFQREIYYESIALLIAALGHIRPISPEEVGDMSQALVPGDTSEVRRERMEKIAQGFVILGQPEYRLFYQDLCGFISDVVGEDAHSFHSIMCVIYLIVALVRTEFVEQHNTSVPVMLTPAIAALLEGNPSIRW